jgi:type IV pilus assembly protein PilC
MQYSIKYRNQKRVIIVLAPFREFGLYGVGAASDETVTLIPMDSGTAWLNRVTCVKSVKAEDLERFYTEMERCMRSGMSESLALKLVTPMAKTPFFRGVLSGIRVLLERNGMKMADAMELFPNAFDSVSIELKRAGEAGGKHSEVYGNLAKRSADTRGLMGKFKTALITPIITLFFLVAALLIMHFMVFPNLEANFKQIRMGGGQLPAPTQIVVGVSNFIRSYPVVWVLPIGAVFTLIFFSSQIFKSKEFEKIAVRVPIIGPAYRLIIMSRSLSALALLEADGVPLSECYGLASKVAGHHEYREYFEAIYNHISKGRKANTGFVAERWRVGEEGADLASRMEVASITGNVAKSLKDSAILMQEKAAARLDVLPKLIGPVVTVAASGIVGVLAMAVFLPTFSLLIDALKGKAH